MCFELGLYRMREEGGGMREGGGRRQRSEEGARDLVCPELAMGWFCAQGGMSASMLCHQCGPLMTINADIDAFLAIF